MTHQRPAWDKPIRYADLPEQVAELAACKGSGVSFCSPHPSRVGWHLPAVEICNACPVMPECRDWARTLPDPVRWEVAGGERPVDRQRWRRAHPELVVRVRQPVVRRVIEDDDEGDE